MSSGLWSPEKRKLQNRNCAKCGKDFRPVHSYNRFCSRQCGAQGRKIEVACGYCGARICRNRSRVINSSALFCNMECRAQWQARFLRGAANPNFRDAGKRICEGCGKEYRSYSKRRKFCGFDCSRADLINSPLNRYKKGIDGEKECLNILLRNGYYAGRMKASRGPFDIFAFKPKREMLFIQVKTTIHRSCRKPPKHLRALVDANLPTTTGILPAYHELWVRVDGEGWYRTRVIANAA